MTATPAIRRANPDDLDALAVLFDLYRQFYKQPADLPRARAFLQERMAANKSVIFVAQAEQKTLIGFTQLYPLFSSVRTARVWVLNDLYIAEKHRRDKTASKLMQAAHDFARSTGAASVQLQTAADNHNAQALYKSLGYKLEQDYLTYSLKL